MAIKNIDIADKQTLDTINNKISQFESLINNYEFKTYESKTVNIKTGASFSLNIDGTEPIIYNNCILYPPSGAVIVYLTITHLNCLFTLS